MKLSKIEDTVLRNIRWNTRNNEGGLVKVNTASYWPANATGSSKYDMAASARTLKSLQRKGLIEDLTQVRKGATCRAATVLPVPHIPYHDIPRREPKEPTILSREEAMDGLPETDPALNRPVTYYAKSRTHDKDTPVHMPELAEGYDHIVLPIEQAMAVPEMVESRMHRGPILPQEVIEVAAWDADFAKTVRQALTTRARRLRQAERRNKS